MHDHLIFISSSFFLRQILKLKNFEISQEAELEIQQLNAKILVLKERSATSQELYDALEEHALSLERKLSSFSSSNLPVSGDGSRSTGMACEKPLYAQLRNSQSIESLSSQLLEREIELNEKQVCSSTCSD